MKRIINEEIPVPISTKTDEILSRRAMLRAALMVGCSLFIPITLMSSPASAADAAKKVAKAGVKYQNQPKGEQKCGTCTNYIAASKTCKRVEGPINPDGWCILWAKKA